MDFKAIGKNIAKLKKAIENNPIKVDYEDFYGKTNFSYDFYKEIEYSNLYMTLEGTVVIEDTDVEKWDNVVFSECTLQDDEGEEHKLQAEIIQFISETLIFKR